MKTLFLTFLTVLSLSLAGVARAAQAPSLDVAADSSFQAALEEISEHFTETTGCAVIFVAAVLSQLPPPARPKRGRAAE